MSLFALETANLAEIGCTCFLLLVMKVCPRVRA
jgi:hypothetical protein